MPRTSAFPCARPTINPSLSVHAINRQFVSIKFRVHVQICVVDEGSINTQACLVSESFALTLVAAPLGILQLNGQADHSPSDDPRCQSTQGYCFSPMGSLISPFHYARPLPTLTKAKGNFPLCLSVPAAQLAQDPHPLPRCALRPSIIDVSRIGTTDLV